MFVHGGFESPGCRCSISKTKRILLACVGGILRCVPGCAVGVVKAPPKPQTKPQQEDGEQVEERATGDGVTEGSKRLLIMALDPEEKGD